MDPAFNIIHLWSSGGRTSARDAVARHVLFYNGRGIGNPDVL